LSDSQFLDTLKSLWVHPYGDKRVKKRLSTVLLAWQEQFKGDPSMSVFAGLYGRLKKEKHMFQDDDIMKYLAAPGPDNTKQKARLEKERREEREREGEGSRRREQEGSGGRRRRRSFNFERVSTCHFDREMELTFEKGQAKGDGQYC
jgi:hypothetical protein